MLILLLIALILIVAPRLIIKATEPYLKNKVVRSGSKAVCGYCYYKGNAYGVPTSSGVTAAWCPSCQKNDFLLEIE